MLGTPGFSWLSEQHGDNLKVQMSIKEINVHVNMGGTSQTKAPVKYTSFTSDLSKTSQKPQ